MFRRLNPLPLTWRVGPTDFTTQLTADKTVVFFRAPFACELVDAGAFVASTKLAASTTAYYQIKILNAGAAGAGTSVIAVKNLNNVAVTAGTPVTLSLASTVAWLKLDAGDYLAVQYDETGALTQYELNGSVGIVYGHEN